MCPLQKLQPVRDTGQTVKRFKKITDYNTSAMSQTESCQCDAAED